MNSCFSSLLSELVHHLLLEQMLIFLWTFMEPMATLALEMLREKIGIHLVKWVSQTNSLFLLVGQYKHGHAQWYLKSLPQICYCFQKWEPWFRMCNVGYLFTVRPRVTLLVVARQSRKQKKQSTFETWTCNSLFSSNVKMHFRTKLVFSFYTGEHRTLFVGNSWCWYTT